MRADDSEHAPTRRFQTHDPDLDYLLLEFPTEDWTVAYLLTGQAPGLVVAEVRIYPTEPAADADPGEWSREADRVPQGGLTTRRLREFGMTEHRNHTEMILAEVRSAMGDEAFKAFMSDRGLSDSQVDLLTDTSRLSSDRSTRLAQIAGLYVAAIGAGEQAPVVAVAERLGVSRSSVRDQLHDARAVGLLSGSATGAAGGSLTAKAKSLLDAAAKEIGK